MPNLYIVFKRLIQSDRIDDLGFSLSCPPELHFVRKQDMQGHKRISILTLVNSFTFPGNRFTICSNDIISVCQSFVGRPVCSKIVLASASNYRQILSPIRHGKQKRETLSVSVSRTILRSLRGCFQGFQAVIKKVLNIAQGFVIHICFGILANGFTLSHFSRSALAPLRGHIGGTSTK
jgi:hypothetical protein